MSEWWGNLKRYLRDWVYFLKSFPKPTDEEKRELKDWVGLWVFTLVCGLGMLFALYLVAGVLFPSLPGAHIFAPERGMVQ